MEHDSLECNLATNYDDIFINHVLFVIGCGHDGGTTLGRLLATLKPTYYLWEPKIFKLLIDPNQKEAIQAAIFDDYILPQVYGRILNVEKRHVAYHEYHWATTKKEIENRNKKIGMSRPEALYYIRKEKPLFIIKLFAVQPYINIYKKIFPYSAFLHIVRNGLEFVQLNASHDFFGPQFYATFEAEFIKATTKLPWWMPEETEKRWLAWNKITRIANYWRFMVNSCPVSVKYEDFCSTPLSYATYLSHKFGLETTELTEEFAKTILPAKEYTKTLIERHGNISHVTYDMIEEPERTEFKKTMDRLGYNKT